VAGASCANDQSGKVFFLFGSFSSEPVKRSCSVPVGTRLFFPLTNIYVDNSPPPFGDGSLRDLHQCAADLTPASTLHLTIDGFKVSSKVLFSLRAASPTFYVTYPNALFAANPFIGTVPAASDGYWVLLPALPKGARTLTFGGSVPSHTSATVNGCSAGAVTQDIAYNLSIRGDD
jgi:hypothetical protein